MTFDPCCSPLVSQAAFFEYRFSPSAPDEWEVEDDAKREIQQIVVGILSVVVSASGLRRR
jgi:hypothetical protein